MTLAHARRLHSSEPAPWPAADYLVVVSTSARALPDTVAPLVDWFIPRAKRGL
jgi:hypothetical protein